MEARATDGPSDPSQGRRGLRRGDRTLAALDVGRPTQPRRKALLVGGRARLLWQTALGAAVLKVALPRVPRTRARRRLETRPGVQVQVDLAHILDVIVATLAVDLLALYMTLLHSRMDAFIWARSKNIRSCISCRFGGFERLGGVAATTPINGEAEEPSLPVEGVPAEQDGSLKGRRGLGRDSSDITGHCGHAEPRCEATDQLPGATDPVVCPSLRQGFS